MFMNHRLKSSYLRAKMSVSVRFEVLLLGLVITQWISLTNTQDLDRLINHNSNNFINYHQQQLVSPINHKQTQFATSPQIVHGLTHHSSGGLILPANNRIEANNFQSSINHAANSMGINNASALIGIREFTSPQAIIDNDKQLRPQRKLEKLPDSQVDQSHQTRNYLQGNIELALRQTSTDENVFQPSPAINIPDSRDLEPWSLQRSSSPAQVNTANPVASSSSGNYEKQNELTTEQSNVISPTHDIGLSQLEAQPQVEHRPVVAEVPMLGHYQNEYPSNSGPIITVPEVNSHQNSTVELHNNVIYEGPATAPPPGDYYFSSSERLPNMGKASNIWWSLGIGHEFERASNLTRDNYLDYCTNSELLLTNKQRSLCRAHPKIMPIVARGLKMAIDECQSRFTSNRWNCSLVLQDSLADAGAYLTDSSTRSQPFGEVMKHPNRERSFLNAIVAAGLAHAMTKACSNGELPEECSCDKKIKSKNNRGKIEWVACSDDIDFGARFSRDFIDNTDNDSDTTSMINLHNYEVGRRVFKSATDITCTCQNGDNGLCQTKRCWKHLGSFTDIGDELMRRYDSATHVQLSSKDPHKLRPVRRGVRKPKRKDLVYIDESPDYCTPNIRLGVLGTHNRRCNSTSSGSDSCSLLCCGRGYQVVVEEIEEDCNCKFVWCCQVKCDKCRRHITNDVCN